ncbi:GntR family transcriptional regulator [Amycolatopsis sp. K13G38]|uniref:GntR family transcriptional regulator n=1 Tax=Amycolatopsis acididurans TaxID=2724524 RepID=A0ABX1IWA9_9PSEU|nr:GntR family transcriptional regulator [Amycolatopsis acididurans]NKQ51771.1 GntR family transcriptional regulator [Amycolatopsis acididurans]
MADNIPAPPLSRTDYVVSRLKQDVADGTLRPGQALRQVQIAQRYGVSVTPVREALRILEADGTITYSPHRGATVKDVDPETATDLYRLRAAVEGLATEIAVERMTPERLEAIEAAHQALRTAQADDAPAAELSKLNKALHYTIYQGGAPMLLDHISTLWSRFPTSVTIWDTAPNVSALDDDHAGILDAIRAGDAERAGALMSAHVRHAGRLRAGTY